MKKRVTLLDLTWGHVRYLVLNQSIKYLVHSFINNQYIPGMYVWLIDPATHTPLSPLSPLLLSSSPPSYPMHTHTQPSNPKTLIYTNIYFFIGVDVVSSIPVLFATHAPSPLGQHWAPVTPWKRYLSTFLQSWENWSMDFSACGNWHWMRRRG